MAIKKTKEQIVTAFRVINSAKLTKMETPERFALICKTRQLKKVSEDFDGLLKDTQEKLKPEGFDAIAEKVQGRKETTPEEAAAWKKYQKDINDCVDTELKKEVEIEIEPLSSESFERFVESNDFSVGEIIAVQDVIGV